MSTAAAIPHKKLAGMRMPVLQGGRWNLQVSKVDYNSITKQDQQILADLIPTLYRKERSIGQNHLNVDFVSLPYFEPGIWSSHRS